LAFQGRIKEVTAMQYPHIPVLALECSNNGRDATKASTLAIFDFADAISIVQVNKTDRRFLAATALSTGVGTREQYQPQCDRANSDYWHTINTQLLPFLPGANIALK
jgi:hypothetical protein